MLYSIAFIPDGNRRYAEKEGISLEQSYVKGFEKVEEVLDWCQKLPDLKNIIFYGLSSENLKREGIQLGLLFRLYKDYIKKLTDSKEVNENKLKVKIVGDKE